MADFVPAFEVMIRNEGGYRLTDTQGDRGGQTYAGIARTRWPAWPGWTAIDRGEIPESALVREFYLAQFWLPIKGDDIQAKDVAATVFDFAVNAGTAIAVKLAQIVAGATPDGKMGPKTLAALNAIDPHEFKLAYALAKVARYAEICNKDRAQSKFLLGWINRTLREAA